MQLKKRGYIPMYESWMNKIQWLRCEREEGGKNRVTMLSIKHSLS